MRSVLVLSALLLSSTAALAAPAPAYDWTGFYIGLNGGFAAGNVDAETSRDESDHSVFGGMFGVQGGYNVMMDNGIVLGFEGTMSYNGAAGEVISDHAGPPRGDQYDRTEYHWTATLAPRVGIAFNQFVVYGKAGLALSGLDAVFHDDTGTSRAAQSLGGALVGVGVEYAATDMVTVGGEANFINYGSGLRDNGAGNGFNAAQSISTFLLHVNFHPH